MGNPRIVTRMGKNGKIISYISAVKTVSVNSDVGGGFYLQNGKPRFHYNTSGPTRQERYNSAANSLNNRLLSYNREVKDYQKYVKILPNKITNIKNNIDSLKKELETVNKLKKLIINRKISKLNKTLSNYEYEMINIGNKTNSIKEKGKMLFIERLRFEYGDNGYNNLLLGVNSSKCRKRPDNVCKLCNHRWIPKSSNLSKKCPKCKSKDVFSTEITVEELMKKMN